LTACPRIHRSPRSLQNRHCHSFQIAQNVVISNTQDLQPALPQIGLAPAIRIAAAIVAHPIQFNDKLRLMAIEISEKRSDRMLPPKFQTPESATAK
jgi:hypothetical protein